MKSLLLGLLASLFLVQVPAQLAPQTNSISVPVPPGATLPHWPAVSSVSPGGRSLIVRSGDLELLYSSHAAGGFILRVAGKDEGVGGLPPVIAYIVGGELRWFDCSQAAIKKQKINAARGGLVCSYECVDQDGATWRIQRRIRPAMTGAIEVDTEISVDQDRAIAFLPLLLVFPGAKSFGATKHQALFSGLEYLENEPSSSEADVIGPAAKRRIPDSLKITFPLMAVQADDRFIGLSWQMRPHLSALFDSPDRTFGSGAHVIGLVFPGSNGQNREEGSLLPHAAELVRAGNVISSRATIVGGPGKSVVPAIEAYCRLRRPPPPPEGPSESVYVSLTSGGWLDSKIREGTLFKHALAGDHFKSQPAADAAVWMQWLAQHEALTPQADRLREVAANVLTNVAVDRLNDSGVGHIRFPVASLVFGHVAENASHAGELAKRLLADFEPDGSVKYHPQTGGPDFSKTHYTNEATGLTSRVVADLLEAASFSGERALLDAALRQLRTMDKFHNGVPRGAQTWECPLHTPDILASAQMVKAYTIGYQLSGDTHYLDEAKYWAWTGVPFVYLVNPTDKPIGLYATIAVFGATQWRAPVWFGLPVQWCGLVYADALYRLAEVDPQGVWKRVADGITVSGMQQSWPPEEVPYQGLLPDSFVLRDQKRNGPAINPATVEACASRYFGPGPAYDFQCLRSSGLLVHAPGRLAGIADSKNRVRFQVSSWVKGPYFVLINGLQSKPRVNINDQSDGEALQFLEKEGRLILKLQGNSRVEFSW